MKNKVSLILSVFSVIIFITSGCTPKAIPDLTTRPLLDPKVVFEKISRFANHNDFIKAEAHISLDSPDRKYSGRVAMAVKKPSSLRIDAIPAFGPADFLLSANEKEFMIFIPGRKKFYTGKPSGKNLYRFFGIPLPADETVSLLTGTPPPTSGENMRIEGSWEENLYRIDVISGGKRVRSIWTRPDGEEMVRIETLNENGTALYTAWFEDYTPAGNGSYPKKIKVSMKFPVWAILKVHYSDIEVSSEGDMSLFNLLPPPGIEPTVID
ncbi:MAG: DUF4292 domain-containing protein [Deltaproteobacteria bacterium]|nr:DUF4292 domain-containing protein [Deltaproteobacteria bacterium]